MPDDSRSNRDLPRYRDLPELPDGGRSGWGLFGDDDSVGLMNLLTPHGVVDAARLIRKGAVFPLDLPIDFIDPPFFQRGATRHRVLERRPGFGLDDVLDNYFPQSGSQWDSLGHVPYEQNSFYNGASSEEVKSGRRNTIDNWARRGIVTRGILLDVADDVAAAGGAGDSTPVTVEFLERARQRAGVEYRPGDVLLIRTGFLDWYAKQGQEVRERQSLRAGITTPGVEHSEELVEYLWDSHAAGVASDTAGLEVFPTDLSRPFGSLHQILIGQFGMALGELWALDSLAADCAADGAFEFLLVSAPLNIPGGIGSPANATAIK